jgi:muconolactone delta-isomerase
MRFLVISKNRHLPPPEMMSPLIDAMIAWSNKMQASGKAEARWALAGGPGGGGILNVDSLDELNALMSEFPFGPFSDTDVIPIVDLVPALERTKQAMSAMMSGGGH